MKKFLTALLCVTTIFFAACSNDKPAVEVTAADVLSVDGVTTVTHDGKISLSGEQKILSPISGNVVATYFERGHDVTEGQPLFKIGKREDSAELLKARAALGESMTALAREIAEKNPAAEDRQAEVDELRARVQKLEDEAVANTVYSPVAGKISLETIQLGAAVTANETVLATIGKNNPVAVRFDISDEEKNLLLTSDGVKVTLKSSDGSTYPREGKLNFSDTAKLEVLFDNPTGRLNLGDAAQVVIDGVKVPSTLLVPEKAVQQREGGNFIFVVDSNKEAALKKISLGGKLGNYFIVNEGLKADEKIIVEGTTNLREGTPLNFRE